MVDREGQDGGFRGRSRKERFGHACAFEEGGGQDLFCEVGKKSKRGVPSP